MSVRADHWIRRMALERGMIEPFEEKLVRRSGQGPIISYGLSSYGYDLRVADEFKVFTNVYNAVGTGMGRARNAGDFKHDTPAGAHLCG